MTGPEHWSEAEQLLNESSCEYGCPHSGCSHEMRLIARAQVHATLAHAAATALPGEHPGDWQREIWAFGPGGATDPDEPAAREIEPEPRALAAVAEDTRRLDAIRGVLAAFDWETDDHQLALEAIERITDGGQP